MSSARERAGWLGAGAVCVAAVLAALGAALALGAVCIPIAQLPRPTGPFVVGTSVLVLGHDIPVQIWYPAAPGAAGGRAPYRFGVRAGPLRARVTSALVQTDAWIDLPVAAGKHPVVLYAPAWGGTRYDNTVQTENLASYGYVVVAMDDLYASRPMDMTSEQTFHATLQWAGDKVRLQAAAARDILSALGRLRADGAQGRFAGHLDLRRAGMFGFSFGGAVAAQAAALDPRIRAAVDLDGWIFADAADPGVPRPFLIVSSSAQDSLAAARSAPGDQRYSDILDRTNLKQMLDGLARYGGYYLTVSGTDHYNFSDVALLPSFRHTGVGPIDSRRAAAIVAAYLVQFFGRYLGGADAPLFEARAGNGARAAARRSMDSAGQLEIWRTPREASRP